MPLSCRLKSAQCLEHDGLSFAFWNCLHVWGMFFQIADTKGCLSLPRWLPQQEFNFSCILGLEHSDQVWAWLTSGQASHLACLELLTVFFQLLLWRPLWLYLTWYLSIALCLKTVKRGRRASVWILWGFNSANREFLGVITIRKKKRLESTIIRHWFLFFLTLWLSMWSITKTFFHFTLLLCVYNMNINIKDIYLKYSLPKKKTYGWFSWVISLWTLDTKSFI